MVPRVSFFYHEVLSFWRGPEYVVYCSEQFVYGRVVEYSFIGEGALVSSDFLYHICGRSVYVCDVLVCPGVLFVFY